MSKPLKDKVERLNGLAPSEVPERLNGADQEASDTSAVACGSLAKLDEPERLNDPDYVKSGSRAGASGGGEVVQRLSEPLEALAERLKLGALAQREAQQLAPEVPALAARRFDQSAGYALSGLWWKDPKYSPLMNCCWNVRASRVGDYMNPVALRLVEYEFLRLIAAGERLVDVLEAAFEGLTKRA